MADGKPVSGATVTVAGSRSGAVTDTAGYFSLPVTQKRGSIIKVSAVGFASVSLEILAQDIDDGLLVIMLVAVAADLSEIVVTGTLKEVSRMQSPVPVEVITPALFRKNPAPSLFESIGMVNGVKPQLNCNVCNTGDIHINGMEGPYTMILIDGMPIVSAPGHKRIFGSTVCLVEVGLFHACLFRTSASARMTSSGWRAGTDGGRRRI